jgi:hypothetical protein
MITKRDEWGVDSSVQRMRRLFASMELAQRGILEQLNILPLDSRLRPVREAAKELFERAWSLAARQGLNLAEEEALGIYVHCLGRALGISGIEVPEGVLTDGGRFKDLVDEASA